MLTLACRGLKKKKLRKIQLEAMFLLVIICILFQFTHKKEAINVTLLHSVSIGPSSTNPKQLINKIFTKFAQHFTS